MQIPEHRWNLAGVINHRDFNVVHLGELAHIVEVQCMAEDGMVRATSEDPRFGSSWQIRLRFPQRIRHRQFRQGVRCFHRVDAVNQ